VAYYAYDYRGRRISRTIYGTPDVTIRYAYDGDRILAEYDGAGTLLRKFVYGPGLDEPICLIDVANGNAAYYYHLDGLGSVVALSDVNKVLVERYAYDVFGRPTIRDPNGVVLAASARGNPYLFTGRAYDGESGLYYYRARYYDYATGRFLQPDPTGYGDGLNLYSYCGNNPVMLVDPHGLFQVTLGFAYGVGGRITIGRNYGRWNVDIALGAGAGGVFKYVPASVEPGPRSEGLRVSNGVELSADLLIRDVEVGVSDTLQLVGDSKANIGVHGELAGAVTVPGTPIELSGSVTAAMGGNVEEGTFYTEPGAKLNPPAVGGGAMVFAGWKGGFAWGKTKACKPQKK
jgi:RHS repeat-associated protein